MIHNLFSSGKKKKKINFQFDLFGSGNNLGPVMEYKPRPAYIFFKTRRMEHM